MFYSPTAQLAPQFRNTSNGLPASVNERRLLRQIWLDPDISRSQITARSDLAQQSIHRILDRLGQRGLVAFGPPRSGMGRGQPSPTLTLNGDYAHACGLAVNTDVMGICLMDLAGRVLGEANVDLHDQSIAEALAEARAAIAGLRGAKGLEESRCFGFGFAIAGWHVGGTRFNASLPLHQWSLVELGPLLSSFFGKPVWTHNGAKTGAIAETLFGIGRHVRHFAYLSFNYGFGGALVSDGQLLLGGNGNAGEFSHIFGTGERRPALQFLIEALRSNGVDIRSIHHLQHGFDPDWPGVAEWLDRAAPAFNDLVDALIDIFDPQAIVLGGQIPPKLGHMLVARRQTRTSSRYGVSRPTAELIVSDIRGNASALGAAALPFEACYF